jgi:N-methylhydantoinase A
VGATINVDTGGTFTDGYFTRGERAERVKVDTTPHDLTECLARCVAEGARCLGYPSVQALLLDTDVFRFSSTIGTNSIIQRAGPRLGLIVSSGAGSNLYDPLESPLFEFMVRKDLVVEVADPFDEAEVRQAVRQLLVAGARVLVVSLEGSDQDPGGEQAIKKAVQADYPRHYLGAVPCLIASEVTPRSGASRRTATAVVNAYLHPNMVKTLYKAEEDLRTEGYPHPLLIVHASGGVARVAKTRAVETYNSGPVGGVHGTARMGALYGLRHVVAMDVGGTSTDVSVVTDGAVPFESDPVVAGVGVHTPMVWVESVGGGGGSIARKTDLRFSVGPESVGASPGPACYGLGGTHATATDAEVVLGHIDPNWFLGGRRNLDAARARAAIERVSADDAAEAVAWNVRGALVQVAAEKVAAMIASSGTPASEFTLFAFGGGGGLYGAEVAQACGIARVFCFVQSSVFSAFGISGMDVSHVYELPPGADLGVRLETLRNRAAIDAAGEGFDPTGLSFQLEVETADGVRVVPLDGKWADAVTDLGGDVRSVRLRATSAIPHAPIGAGQKGEADPSAAKKGERAVYRLEGAQQAAVYDRDLLRPGHIVPGPALIEAVDTTIVVPGGSQLSIDEYGTGIIEEAS